MLEDHNTLAAVKRQLLVYADRLHAQLEHIQRLEIHGDAMWLFHGFARKAEFNIRLLAAECEHPPELLHWAARNLYEIYLHVRFLAAEAENPTSHISGMLEASSRLFCQSERGAPNEPEATASRVAIDQRVREFEAAHGHQRKKLLTTKEIAKRVDLLEDPSGTCKRREDDYDGVFHVCSHFAHPTPLSAIWPEESQSSLNKQALVKGSPYAREVVVFFSDFLRSQGVSTLPLVTQEDD